MWTNAFCLVIFKGFFFIFFLLRLMSEHAMWKYGNTHSPVTLFLIFSSTAFMFQEGFGWTNGVFLTLVDRFPDLVPSPSSREQQTSSGHLDILWFRFRFPDINFIPLQDIFYFLNAVSVKFYDRWNAALRYAQFSLTVLMYSKKSSFIYPFRAYILCLVSSTRYIKS